MDEDLKAKLALWREVITKRITTSERVCLTPCFVFAVSFELTDGTLVYDCHLYDGSGVAEEEKLTFVGQFTPPQFCPSTPMFFRKGLYAHLETNVASMTIMYISIRE